MIRSWLEYYCCPGGQSMGHCYPIELYSWCTSTNHRNTKLIFP
uniref:Uncharacterized protein n=1 Tax=Arundo donax TaxID=35708 RepID=A0A0A9CA07_ARUDO